METGLELSRVLVFLSGVFAVMVVVGVDVGEDFSASVVGVDEDSALQHFAFEGFNEKLPR